MTRRAPIALFAYNRPDHLRQALEQLARAEWAGQSDLVILCDGPKAGADPRPVEAVRALAQDPVWTQGFRSVRVTAAAANQGLARSIIGGVTRVLETSDRVIVIEDDVLVAPDFLRFLNDCLGFYRGDPRVGSVTGFSPLAAPPAGYVHDVMALPRNCSHGWGTWADRWQRVDWEARAAAQLWRDPALRRRFSAAGNDRLDRLRRQLAGENDSWSIRFGLWQALEDRVTIYPVLNRVRNIGFDGSGVHTRAGEEVNPNRLTSAHPYRLEHTSIDPAILARVRRIYAGPLPKRLLRGLRARLLARRLP